MSDAYADYPKNDFIFDIGGDKVLFENVAWNEPTNPRYLGEKTADYFKVFFDQVPTFTKLNRSTTYNSAEDFRFCLCSSQIEFSCINRPPVITPIFDYDCLSEEKFNKKRELEEKYRQGLMPPDISYEFPVTIPYKGQDISCIVRFRDTATYEIYRFTVELAKGEHVPAGWQKNEYGEYAFPNDDLWKARGFSKIFPAYDMQCSPFEMYLRLGETKPITEYIPES